MGRSKENPPTGVPAPWRVAWSNSKSAWYYYHSETKEVTWIHPGKSAASQAQPNKAPGAAPVPSAAAGAEATKRGTESSEGPPLKRPRLDIPVWSEPLKKEGKRYRAIKEFAANALKNLSSRLDDQNSIPEQWCVVEIARHREIQYLRNLFREHCLEHQCKVPSGAFERWIFTQRLVDDGKDPILPSEARLDSGLFEELQRFGMNEEAAEAVCLKLAKDAVEANTRLSEFQQTCYEDEDSADPAVTTDESSHYRKLKRIYDQAKSDPELFHPRVFRLLCRYDALGGPGYQGALPEIAFGNLIAFFGVTHECFASPLNGQLPTYGSAFPDVDRWFGSTGDFFRTYSDLMKNGGAFEANPPFVEETMEVMTLAMMELLDKVEKPLTFVVVVPNWPDTPSLVEMTESRYNRKLLTFKKKAHTYKEGSQHCSTGQYRASDSPTAVFVLQNDAAFAKCPPTPAFVSDFTASFTKRPEEIGL